MICRGSDILKVRAEGVPIGLLDSREYDEVTFQAQPGDLVVLYSDGITDHMDSAGREFGRGRLAQILRGNCRKPAVDVVSAIFRELDAFSTTAFDDQTVFALKVR
jgi:sigma-B regulation protein RsbU (phosphoserine phosphatase)